MATTGIRLHHFCALYYIKYRFLISLYKIQFEPFRTLNLKIRNSHGYVLPNKRYIEIISRPILSTMSGRSFSLEQFNIGDIGFGEIACL